MAGKCIFLIFIAVMSREDIKSGDIPLLPAAIFSAAALFAFAAAGPFSLASLIAGVSFGAAMVPAALLTDGLGLGDACIFMTAGLCLGGRADLTLAAISFILAAAASLMLLLVKKGGRKTRIPFAPFVLAAFMLLLAAGSI